MRATPHVTEYAELKQILTGQGLFDRQPVYYTYKVLQALCCLGLAIGIFLASPPFWLQLLNAAFLAFVFTQIAFIGHDAGHRQIFQSARASAVLGLFCTLLTAISYSWWTEKHAQHHRHPNHLGRDPDVKLRFLAFSEEQTRGIPGWRRVIMTYQAQLLVPMLLLQGIASRAHSLRFLLASRAKFSALELLLIVGHIVLYVGVVYAWLGIWQGITFILVHQMLFGLYMGSVFAPNHKGMLMFKGDSPMDRLRQQVLTARNVRAHPLTDFWFGGLNYQIEHHLFPQMARNRLQTAQATVRAFCMARAIPYHETSLVQSYREIWRYLDRVSAPRRDADEGPQRSLEELQSKP
jgi:fatty acid desaturase